MSDDRDGPRPVNTEENEEHEEHEDHSSPDIPAYHDTSKSSPPPHCPPSSHRPSSIRTARDESRRRRPDILRTISTRSLSVVRVPRNQTTGLLARLCFVYEAEEPQDYPRKLKWLIVLCIAMAACTAPMGSSIILPALSDITHDFHTTATIANLSVALYMLAMSVFPLWWSALSESQGRRTVYITAFLAYVAFNVAAAVSTSIGMFIAFRFLSGGTSASVQAVGAGTIADIFRVHERGRAMGIFYLGPLAGPLVAPIIGGALSQGLGWRSTQWFQVIFGAVIFLALLLVLPETHRLVPTVDEAEKEAIERSQDPEKGELSRSSSAPPLTRLTSRKSVAVTTKKWIIVLRRFFLDPLHIATYLRFPAVALTVAYASIAFGCLYFLNISVEKTFSSPPYNFRVIEVGLLYISNSLGYFVCSIVGGKWVDSIMAREARKADRVDSRGKLMYRPEDRLRENAWVGAMLMPVALLWYGWTANFGVFWVAPIIANFFFGAGSMLIFAAATTMLTEFMPKKASSGVALNNFVRNIFAFLGTFLAEPLINAIGNGWLFTILALIAFIASPIIYFMKKRGSKWRETMDREMD